MDSKEYEDDEEDRERTFSVDMRFDEKDNEIDEETCAASSESFINRSPGIKLNLQAVAAAAAKREEGKEDEEHNIQEDEVLVRILTCDMNTF